MKIEGLEYEAVGLYDIEIKESSINSISILNIFPVPTEDILNIEFLSSSTDILVEVFSMDGRLLLKQNIKSIPDQENTAQLDVSNLQSGSYLIVVQNREGRECKSIVKVK